MFCIFVLGVNYLFSSWCFCIVVNGCSPIPPGHGIGAYLNVHEGPMGISWRDYADDPGLCPGMFLSNGA